jgi:hypothetical protein
LPRLHDAWHGWFQQAIIRVSMMKLAVVIATLNEVENAGAPGGATDDGAFQGGRE